MTQRPRKLLAALLCSGCFATLAAGVSLEMDNGDVLTGEMVGETETEIRFSVDYLGELSVPKERIANLAELSGPKEVEEEPQPAEETEAVAGAPVDGTGSDAAWEVYEERISALIPFPQWEKRIQLGMTAQSGRYDKTDVYYRYDMQKNGEKNQYVFNAEYSYGRSGEKTTSDRFATGLRWRRDIGPGVFYQSTSNYSSDAIKRIDSNVEQKLGLGTRIIEREDMILSSGLGASGRWRAFDDIEREEEIIYLVDLFQDWDYRINERLRLRQDLRFAMPIEENDQYEYDFTAALVSEITESLNLSLRYELGYDNSLDEELRSDRRFISTLGYTF